MRLFLYPSRDATIYSEYPSRNSGLDEILEVGKTLHGAEKARALLAFDLSEVSASIADGTIPADVHFDLELRVARASDLKAQQSVHVGAVSQSWDEGTGYYYQENTQEDDGVTWSQPGSGSEWTAGSGVVGEYVSASVAQPIEDMTFDVTTLVTEWLSGSAENHGFLVKYPDADEENIRNFGILRFFSKDTHTVYRPTLVAKWDDQTFSTGSLSPVPASGLTVAMSTLRPAYRVGEVARVDVTARERYPTKTFDTVFTNYAGSYYLPETSYYRVVDEQSGVEIIPFDEYSKISTSPSGSYFTFRVENMHPRRYYRVEIKVVHDGLVEIFAPKVGFTVID